LGNIKKLNKLYLNFFLTIILAVAASLLLWLMDTRPIPFELQCEEGAHELKFIHNIPSRLVNPKAPDAQRNGRYGCLLLPGW
jgi:hypothetical protein